MTLHDHFRAAVSALMGPGIGINYSPPPSAEVKNAWSDRSFPSIRFHGVEMEYCTFNITYNIVTNNGYCKMCVLNSKHNALSQANCTVSCFVSLISICSSSVAPFFKKDKSLPGCSFPSSLSYAASLQLAIFILVTSFSTTSFHLAFL